MPNFIVYETRTAQITITNQTSVEARISIQAELKGSLASVPAMAPEQAIPAGASATFPMSFVMPGTPGTYELLIDVLGRFPWETTPAVIAEYAGSELVNVLAPKWNIGFAVTWG